jgi:hypothetical protein
MVAHQAEAQDVNLEAARHELQALLNPLATMIIVFSSHAVLTTQEGAPHTSARAMIGTWLRLIDLLGTRNASHFNHSQIAANQNDQQERSAGVNHHRTHLNVRRQILLVRLRL